MTDNVARALEQIQSSIEALNVKIDSVMSLAQQTLGLVGPFGVPMPSNKMLVQTIHGTKYLIDPNDHVMAPQLIVYRQWEPDLSHFICSECDSDTVFVDVGANFGYFSCLAGSRIGSSGKGQVFAIEPNPNLVDLLKVNAQINWSMAPLHIHQAAAGGQNGSAVLSIPKSGAANASLTQYDSSDFDRVAVDIRRVDDIVGLDHSVDLMKIDVEGHEAGVLEGARATIQNSPNIQIIMEWSQWQIKDAGYVIADVISLIKELGLSVFDVSSGENIPYEHLNGIEYANILLKKKI